MSPLLEQPQLGTHVVPTAEGQGARMNPGGRSTVHRLQLTLAVVGELVLHAHSLLGLLGDLLQPPEHTVEVEATTDLAQELTLPALKELMGDDAAHSTCRGR